MVEAKPRPDFESAMEAAGIEPAYDRPDIARLAA